MISEATQRLLRKLYQVQNTYQPSAAITAQLSAKTLVAIVGATCVGKNTVMQALAASDNRFGIAGNFTSRSAREDDDAAIYTYYDNTDTGLAPLLQRIAQKQVVQYAVNPHSLQLYGTEPTDYPYAFNLKDIFSGAVDGFRQLGFKNVVTITVVTEPEVWQQRFEVRFPVGHPDRDARRNEAMDSLSWSLAQSETDHCWTENVDGQPGLAANEIKAIALGQSHGQPAARELAEACLKTARAINV